MNDKKFKRLIKKAIGIEDKKEEKMSELKSAGVGEVYVCGACGKVFKDPYKVDVSCMLNRVLCKEDSLEYDKNGRVIKANPVEEEE